MINGRNIDAAIKIVKQSVSNYQVPVLERFNDTIKDPYWVLIPCILSLRAKDEVTAIVSENLYRIAPTPEQVIKISLKEMEKIVYKTGFYHVKAKNVLSITKIILNKYKGIVPDSIEELLTIPGVGRKTANLVVTVAFKKLGICIDTHVHKISNRWGYVKTKDADHTEIALREILPKKYWLKINLYLVLFGQNTCLSVSPFCSKCPLTKMCPKIGITTSR
ncbi:MAG: endonuclease III [bacterium]